MNTFKLKIIPVFAAILFALTSCQKEVLPEKEVPSADTLSIPGPPPVPNPPVSDVPVNPIPGVLKKASYSALDFRTFQYDTEGRLTQYYSQYNYVQGTDIVTKRTYQYSYNAAGELSEMTDPYGQKTNYTYRSGLPDRAISYNLLHEIVRVHHFTYNQRNQVAALHTSVPAGDGSERPEKKVILTYDTRGNLVLWNESYYDVKAGKFGQAILTQYSDFDDQKFLKYSIGFGDVLQPLTFWVNNPGKKQRLNLENPVEHYSYVYDANGYPVKKVTTFTYTKPLPQMEEVFSH